MYRITLTGSHGQHETRTIRTRHALKAYAFALSLLSDGWVGYRVRRVA